MWTVLFPYETGVVSWLDGKLRLFFCMLCASLELFFKNIPCGVRSLRSPVRGECVRAARVVLEEWFRACGCLKRRVSVSWHSEAFRGFLGIVPPARERERTLLVPRGRARSSWAFRVDPLFSMGRKRER